MLNRLDRIERIYGNSLMNRMRARRGDTIYHCIFCRLQFYDPRKPRSTRRPAEAGKPPQDAPASPENKEAELARPAPAAPAVPPESAPLVRGTIFGAAVTVRGSIQSEEDIYIDGRVEGSLASHTHRITIGPRANVKANVRALHLEVRGTLRGNLRVEGKTALRAGATVVGDIRTADIVVEDGASFKGSVDLVRKQELLPLA